ncbi:MAG: alpha/beta fold hydrolase [Butyricicoccus sp.]|nr:alpha/beta fold hydrolase [Butyricicoccus sp.]
MFSYHIASGTASLLCREWGEGDPLVLLHGNGEDSLYFAKQFDLFARYFRVIAIDSRGHGGSTHGEEGLSIGLMAEDVLAVLDVLGIERAHLLGFSDGGNIALSFALRWPERTDKLVLNGANIRMFEGVMPWVSLPLYPICGALRVLGKFDPEAVKKREVLELMVHDHGVSFDDLGWIEAETLVITGEHDLIRTEETDRIAAALPRVQRVTIAGADHFCAAKAPHRFNLAVLKFLRDKQRIPHR